MLFRANLYALEKISRYGYTARVAFALLSKLRLKGRLVRDWLALLIFWRSCTSPDIDCYYWFFSSLSRLVFFPVFLCTSDILVFSAQLLTFSRVSRFICTFALHALSPIVFYSSSSHISIYLLSRSRYSYGPRFRFICKLREGDARGREMSWCAYERAIARARGHLESNNARFDFYSVSYLSEFDRPTFWHVVYVWSVTQHRSRGPEIRSTVTLILERPSKFYAAPQRESFFERVNRAYPRALFSRGVSKRDLSLSFVRSFVFFFFF